MGSRTFADMAAYWPYSTEPLASPMNLVDEYRLLVHPVAIGKGQSIFSDLSAPFSLELIDSKAFGSGAVAHTYHRH
jgi:dihydrofolate reductase